MPIGAWMTLAVGVLFSIFAAVTAGHNHLFAVLVAGAPLILAAILMMVGLNKQNEGYFPVVKRMISPSSSR